MTQLDNILVLIIEVLTAILSALLIAFFAVTDFKKNLCLS